MTPPLWARERSTRPPGLHTTDEQLLLMSTRRAQSANSTSSRGMARPFHAIQSDTGNNLVEPSLSSPSSSSSSSSPSVALSPAPDFSLGIDIDDLSRDLAVLAELRENLQRNLRLRPIRSFGALPKLAAHNEYVLSSRTTHSDSPSSSSATSSVYHSPVDHIPSSRPSSPLSCYSLLPPALSPPDWDPGLLNDRLSFSRRPLLIDTRPHTVYQACHLSGSFNIAIPSLILKRHRKPRGGFHSLDDIRQFITSEDDKQRWDIQSSKKDVWDGHIVIIHGEETDESEKENLQVTAWALLSVLSVFLGPDRVHYLKGGMVEARQHPRLCNHLVFRDIRENSVSEPLTGVKGKGVFQLNTAVTLTKVVPSLVESQTPDSPRDPKSPPSHLTCCPMLSLRHFSECTQSDRQLTLPRLQVHVEPTHSTSTSIPPSQSGAGMNQHLLSPQSPSHLTLVHSNHSPPASSPLWVSGHSELCPASPSMFLQTNSPPPTPDTPLPSFPLCSPRTARPSPAGSPLTTSDDSEGLPSFSVSTILPGFLYLGPELTLPVHVTELKSLGIRRILNIAAECDADDYGLNLRDQFERYVRIPMRDTVEEEKVRTCLHVVCEILGLFLCSFTSFLHFIDHTCLLYR